MSVMSAEMMDVWMQYRAAVALLEAAERAEAQNEDVGLRMAHYHHVGDALYRVQRAYERLRWQRIDECIYWDMEIGAGEQMVITEDRSRHHPVLKVGRRLEVYYTARPDETGITFKVLDWPTPGADTVMWLPRAYVEGAARRVPRRSLTSPCSSLNENSQACKASIG